MRKKRHIVEFVADMRALKPSILRRSYGHTSKKLSRPPVATLESGALDLGSAQMTSFFAAICSHFCALGTYISWLQGQEGSISEKWDLMVRIKQRAAGRAPFCDQWLVVP